MRTIFQRPLLIGLLALVGSALACNPHNPKSISISIDASSIGISIPIPPPSLTAAPVQDVEWSGKLSVTDEVSDIDVVLHELNSGREYEVTANDDGSFEFTSVSVDFTANCFEVFTEIDEDGDLLVGDSHYYEAVIGDDDQSGELVPRAAPCDATRQESIARPVTPGERSGS